MFTVQHVKSLKPSGSVKEVMEGGGFGVRVHPSGSKTWIYRYRYAGKLKRMSLGQYPAVSLAEARTRHQKAQGKHREHRDPQGGIETVEELAALYIERHAKKKKKSWEVDQKMLERDVVPRIGRMKIGAVRKLDIIQIIDAVNDRGSPIMANRVLAVTKTMFSFAVKRDLMEHSPALYVERPNTEHSVDRVLSDTELQALMSRDGAVADVVRLMALTGQRLGEIVKMRYLDLERDLWTIPGELTKNSRQHAVPLVEAVWPIIDAQESPNDWVFQVTGNSVSQWYSRNKLGYTPHDIRRTVATRLAQMKVPRVVIGKLLNHTDPSVTAIYDRYEYMDEMREALEAWAQHIVGLGK